MTAGGPADPVTADREPPPTLGQRLAAAATDAIAHRSATLPWLERAAPVLDRVDRLADTGTGRFERVDTPVDTATGAWAGDDGPVADPAWHAAPGPPVAPPREPWAGTPGGGRPGGPGGGTDGDTDDDTALPAALRERLRPLVGTGLDGVRVHRGPQADALARASGAAAVTVGEEIFFRTGRFRPETPDGRALLAHELTHVAQGRRGQSSWLRASAAGVAEEERAAEVNAAAARSHPVGPVPASRRPSAAPAPAGPPGRPASPAPPVSSPPPAPPPAVVRAAAADPSTAGRPMRAPDSPAGAASPPGTGDRGPDLRALRESVRRDLLRTLRTDAERGG